MHKSRKEIEHFLFLYPIANAHIAEINESLQYSDLSEDRKSRLFQEKQFYIIIVNKVDKWLSYLDIDEREIIFYRYFKNLNYEQITTKLHYGNHSSAIRKVQKILLKLERSE